MKTKHNYLFGVAIAIILLLLESFTSRGQFWDGSSGLLQMPSADMHKAGTFTISNNILNKHSITYWYWGYNTFAYSIDINLWSRLEIGYVCVLLNGSKNPSDVPVFYRIMRNQDRHFTAKALLLKEGEFGLKWMPALAIGVSDPISGATSDDYTTSDVSGQENGFFNRYYVVATKHFGTKIGTIGAHLGYQYNRRTDLPLNGPCAGIDWVPVWLNKPNLKMKVIAEYDSRTFNVGFIASIWRDHFDIMFELMSMKWVNCGLRYKLVLQ